MDELEMHLPESLRMQVMDFSLLYETMHTSLERDANAQAKLGQSDICFVVNAPLDYFGWGTHASALIYLDQESYSREMPEHGYQLVYTPSPWADNFHDWAQHSMQYLRESLFGTGMVCTDLADFLQVLKVSQSRRLRYELISYDHPPHAPNSKLDKVRYKTLFAILFGAVDLSLSMYIELEAAIEKANPNLSLLKSGMKIYSCEPPVVLLLGEPDD
ncbi:hypothetical protein [Pseudomonas paeninsulae]|uniref:hypothetical protein n=1 Tax=Pseudomonas paeninsulae TaxID=3110772 RepID=UPI002D7742D3|nr:hypothetical protein [Pseudomonas sp. IT1137]